MQAGVKRFIQDMARLGFEAILETDLVIYRVVAVDGAYAGRSVETGVSIGEIQPWPEVPPHWLHFPDTLRFLPNQLPTFFEVWMADAQPADNRMGRRSPCVAWASHVRAVLSEAVA